MLKRRATPRRRLAAEPRPSHPSRVRLHSEFARPPPTQRLNQNSNWTCPLRPLRARATLVSCRDHTSSSNLPSLRCFYLRPKSSRSERPPGKDHFDSWPYVWRLDNRHGRSQVWQIVVFGDMSDGNCVLFQGSSANIGSLLSPNAQSRSSILITEPRVDLSNRQRSAKSSSTPRSTWVGNETNTDVASGKMFVSTHSRDMDLIALALADTSAVAKPSPDTFYRLHPIWATRCWHRAY